MTTGPRYGRTVFRKRVYYPRRPLPSLAPESPYAIPPIPCPFFFPSCPRLFTPPPESTPPCGSRHAPPPPRSPPTPPFLFPRLGIQFSIDGFFSQTPGRRRILRPRWARLPRRRPAPDFRPFNSSLDFFTLPDPPSLFPRRTHDDPSMRTPARNPPETALPPRKTRVGFFFSVPHLSDPLSCFTPAPHLARTLYCHEAARLLHAVSSFFREFRYLLFFVFFLVSGGLVLFFAHRPDVPF